MKTIFVIAITGIALATLLIGCNTGGSKTVPTAAVNPPATSTNSLSTSSISPLPTSPLAPSISTSPQTQDMPEAVSDILQNDIRLTVTNPIDGADINTDTVAVNGQTIPGAAINVNDTVGVADANGNFSVIISLEQGPNAIDVVATDNSGKEGEVLIIVNAVSSGASAATSPIVQSPVSPGTIPLTVTQPVDAVTLSTDTVTVKGETVPGATVIINDQTVTADGNGNFSLTVYLVSGLNVIDVMVQDDNGNNNEVTIMVDAP